MVEDDGLPVSRVGKARVLNVLRNPVYLGRRRWGGQVHAGEHPAIITEEEFKAAQERLAANGARGEPSARETAKRYYRYLLDGLVRCALCGAPMSTSTAHGRTRVYFYYRCSSELSAKGCPQKPINAQELDRFITEEVVKIATDPARIRAATQESIEEDGASLRRLRTREGLLRRELAMAEERPPLFAVFLGEALFGGEVIADVVALDGADLRLDALGEGLEVDGELVDLGAVFESGRCRRCLRDLRTSPCTSRVRRRRSDRCDGDCTLRA